MKRRLVYMMAALVMLCMTSCSMFDKLSYESYITNYTDSDVTITYPNAYEGLSPVFVKAGETVQVSDIFRWDLHVKTPTRDTVYFEFANGESYIHVYERMLDGKNTIKYYPEENNIFKVDLYDCEEPYSWEVSKIRSMKMRADYFVK